MTEQELLGCIQSRMPFASVASMDSNLFDELGFDSMLLLDLVVAVEEKCRIRVPEDRLRAELMDTPRKLMLLIESCRNAACDGKAQVT